MIDDSRATSGACDSRCQRIFVIEDNASIRDIVSAVLRRHGGYEVATAEDGIAALARLETEFEHRTSEGQRTLNVDLLIVDIMMPRMSGLELLDMLQRTYSMLPRVMVLSALDDEARVAEALQLGAIDYVPKPFETSALLHRVQALFGTSGDRPFHWAPLPGRPTVMLGTDVALGRAISEGGIIVERGSEQGPAVHEVVPLASAIFVDFRIPRQVHGRVVQITKLGRRMTVELSFVGLPDREMHGIRRYTMSR